MMKFDLHVHTTLSACSHLPLPDILNHARRRGLDGVCITDHDTSGIRDHFVEGVQKDGLVVLVGMEYATLEGDFLLFGLEQDPPLGLPAESLLLQVQSRGGVAVAAHPFRKNRPVAERLMQLGLIRMVESLNGRNRSIEDLQVEKWRKRYRFFEVGGSDAHRLDELGRVCTFFSKPVRSQEELVKALQNGACRSGINPVFQHSSRLPG